MKEIEEIIKTWISSSNEPSEEIKRQIEEAEKFLKTYSQTNISHSNPETHAISQHLPINSNSSKSVCMYFKYCITISSFTNILTFNITFIALCLDLVVPGMYFSNFGYLLCMRNMKLINNN